MKSLKLVIAILLVLGIAGVVTADNIPQVNDPKNYPTVWTANVYNGSGSDIVSSYIVQWDFDTSDSAISTWYDDSCPYVKTADSAGDIWTAGVVPYGNNLSNGTTGVIIIRGPAFVYRGSNSVTVNQIVETSAAGQVSNHDGAATDEGTLGVAIKATITTGPNETQGASRYPLIYIHPIQYDKD